MKGYFKFLLAFGLLFVIYVIAEINRPQAVDWTITLSKDDKNPYGGFIVYEQLKDLFPKASIQSYRKTVYDQINNSTARNSAYIITAKNFSPSNTDIGEMLSYVKNGNYFLIAAPQLGKALLDTLGLKLDPGYNFLADDSTSINFSNPALKTKQHYIFRKNSIDEYFSSFDTSRTTVLGVTNSGAANFVQIKLGKGSFYVHAAALCFSNYFMLFKNNHQYLSCVFSYLPANLNTIYWDEYYKLGPKGQTTPLYFFLTRDFLKWAFWLSLICLVLYVLFEMKRRQRIIPIITPLRNTTLDFVNTVSGVYFNQRDNHSIATKKIQFWLEFIRQRFYLTTNNLDDNFSQTLKRKSGVSETLIQEIIQMIDLIQSSSTINDTLLIELNNKIDSFYHQAK